MKPSKPSKTELRILEMLWTHGSSSIREIQEKFPEKTRPAYTTVQTTVYRLEAKKALRRVKKPSNANVFEPIISRTAAQRNFIDEFLGLFGGQMQPVMRSVDRSGQKAEALEDIQAAEKTLRQMKGKNAVIRGAAGSPLAIQPVRRLRRIVDPGPARQRGENPLTGCGSPPRQNS